MSEQTKHILIAVAVVLVLIAWLIAASYSGATP